MPTTSPRPAETKPEVGYQHSAPCLYCYLGNRIHVFHNHVVCPPPKPPAHLTAEETKAFNDAQKKADEGYWASCYAVRRWALLIAGTSIVVMTIINTKRLYDWMHDRGATVAKMYGYASVQGGKWTVRKDWMLRLAFLLVVNSPCACFAGYLIATAYYWKDKRDRTAKRKADKAKRQLEEIAAEAANPDPKLMEMRYEDLPSMQKIDVVIRGSDVPTPVPTYVGVAKGKGEGVVGRSVASWWSEVTTVHKNGYDGRDVRKQNWEDERNGIELQNRDTRAHASWLGENKGGVGKKARPLTEWPDWR